MNFATKFREYFGLKLKTGRQHLHSSYDTFLSFQIPLLLLDGLLHDDNVATEIRG